MHKGRFEGRGAVHSLRHRVGQGRDEERDEDGVGRGPVVQRKAERRIRQRGQALHQAGGYDGRAIRCQLLFRILISYLTLIPLKYIQYILNKNATV